MPVAALYDIHGNLPALQAVLGDASRSGAEAIVVGGDVAAGPLPAATIDQLMALGERARFVRGNADREVVEAYDAGLRDPIAEADPARRAAAFAASRISPRQRGFLASFAATVGLEIDALGPTLFCHASPRSDMISFMPAADERDASLLVDDDPNVIVFGHTHLQFRRPFGRHTLVNPGVKLRQRGNALRGQGRGILGIARS